MLIELEEFFALTNKFKFLQKIFYNLKNACNTFKVTIWLITSFAFLISPTNLIHSWPESKLIEKKFVSFHIFVFNIFLL